MGMQRETQEAHDSLVRLEEICLPLLAGPPPQSPLGTMPDRPAGMAAGPQNSLGLL